MKNQYIPQLAKIIKIRQESADSNLYSFKFLDRAVSKGFAFSYGQFLMAGILGLGEAAFDICSSPYETESFDLTIRQVGNLTEKIHELKVGDVVSLRGPFGNGFPVDKFQRRNIVLISGGCGFVTMRSFIIDYLAGRLNPGQKMQLFYGCLNEEALLYKKEHASWRKKIKMEVILDEPSKKWLGQKGIITKLLRESKILENSVAILCGPPVMYKFIIAELDKLGFSPGDIYLSLERRMHCGVGVCQHCTVGPYYVCQDGPVFSWAQLKEIPGAV